MKAKRVFLSLLLAGAVVVGAPARADYPVIDIANLAQALESFMQLSAQLQQLERQYTQMQQQYQSLTGSRNMGGLFNGGSDQEMRMYAPGSWQQSLSILQRGGLPGNAATVQMAGQSFAQTQGINQSGTQVFPGSAANAQAYNASSGATAAAAGLSEAAYNQTQARMQRVQQYLAQINGTSDVKASIDLNARLLAEVNEALTQMIQLEAAQIQVQGSANAAQLRGKVQEAAFVPYQVQ
ncbi:MAG TPA: type IV secretion system protein [Nevskia sp.]|jgi:type IV secretion system protein VirB5|nr:type IV secretion system protein [Nevskia sp.]